MLGEEEGEVGGLEVGAEGEDVGEGGGGHVEEEVLHVDDEEGCGHDDEEWTSRFLSKLETRREEKEAEMCRTVRSKRIRVNAERSAA